MAATVGRYAFNEIVAEPLNKENHEAWFALVKNYLIARDLWDVVDGTFAKPPEDEDHKQDFVRWRRMNAAALHAIQISSTTESISHIRGVSEAKDAWNILSCAYNPPLSEFSLPQPQVMRVQADFDVRVLYDAIRDNDRGATNAFIDQHPGSLNAILTPDRKTTLHVAAMYGREAILEDLVTLAPPQYLEMVDDFNCTPLSVAVAVSAESGDNMIRVAECMVEKSTNILGIPNQQMNIPVTVAFSKCHKEMGRYLYTVTPLELLKPGTGNHGPMLLFWCFIGGSPDVALDLLQRCQELLFAEMKDGWTPIKRIASMPAAFSNGSKLVFWKRWIYNYININSTTITNFVRVDIHQQGQSRRVPGLGLLQRIISHTYNILGMKEIYETKSLHAQAGQILRLIGNQVTVSGSEGAKIGDALFCAVREGFVEFVAEIIKANASNALFTDSSCRHLFFYAVEYRQAEIFKLIRETHFKNMLVTRVDVQTGNSMLHVAGNLAPSSQLNRISGPAFQMQSELQWFKEVESMVPPGFKVLQNHDGMMAKDIFKESHKELRKEGEKWMKDTASYCSVVGTLVVTIMFAAAFTVPGGNDQNSGYPIFLGKEKLFLLFVTSDALSLFSSTTSVLIFLGILTSRYAEEDFLKAVPTKLIIGLSTLFLSIATMMIAFSVCILLMLQHKYSWSFIPVVILAGVPITLFVLLQFPLLIQMFSSTYGPGIFKRKRNVKP